MKASNGRPTLKDVSAATGFSTYTVSRALADLPGVSEKTRLFVREAAAEVGYVPNRLAQTLKQKSSSAIGFLTANNSNPFYSALVNAFEEVVIPQGFHCIVSDATDHGHYSEERESRFLENLLEQRVAGVALTYQPTGAQMRRLSDWGLPVVFVDSNAPAGHPEIPAVFADGEDVSFAVGMHFFEHGYMDWLFVGHPTTWPTRITREKGIRRAARVTGARLTVIEGHNDTDDAEAAVERYLGSVATPPRAIFVGNEPLLTGAMRALRKARLRVPEDVALIGYDAFAWAELLTPAITLVDQGIEKMGRLAGDRMLYEINRANGVEAGSTPSVDLPPSRLIIRESCGCSQ
jgi:LacI family transcriptional regulator